MFEFVKTLTSRAPATLHYDVMDIAGVPAAIMLARRLGRLPVTKVRGNGYGGLQWTGKDGVVETIGDLKSPVAPDVLNRLAIHPDGLLLVEFDGNPPAPVGEQSLKPDMSIGKPAAR